MVTRRLQGSLGEGPVEEDSGDDSELDLNAPMTASSRDPSPVLMNAQVADMLAWASAHEFSEYLKQRDGTHPPYNERSSEAHVGEGHDLIVLPGGTCDGCQGSRQALTVDSGKSAEGVVFTCERLIVDNLVPAIHAGGMNGIAVKADGTYKIAYEGGWELFSIGTHAVKYDKSKGYVRHTFRPFLFAYIKSESNKNLHDLVLPSLLRLVDGVHPPCDAGLTCGAQS